MVKKMISRLSVLTVLIVFATACSKKSEYTNVIPADATAIASVNLKTLAEKAGLGSKENEELKQKMLNAFKSGANAVTFQQLEKVINNPSESGIDVTSPIYLFTAPSFPYTSILAQVNSEGNLRSNLEILAKEQICQPVIKEDGYSYTTIGNAGLLAFNESVALVVATNGASASAKIKEAITLLMKQTAENSINKVAGFKKMQEQKGEVAFFASMAAIPDMYASQVSMGLPANVDPKDIMLLGSLGFEKGKVALQFKHYTENKEVEALLKKQEKAFTKLNTTFLKYFPESTLTFLNVGANGAELYNLLLENEEFRNNVSIAKAAEVKELFNSFNGDISAGLLNVSMMNNNPTMLAYADVKNGDALKTVYNNKQALGLKKGEDILKLGENEYVYKSKAMNIFFGVKDKQLYATNDEMLYKNIGKPVDKSIKDAEYASDMKGKNLFWVINMKAILEMPVVKMMIGFGGEEYQMYYNLASKVSFLELSNESDGKTEIDLILENKDENALKQIVDFVRQFVNM